jgi:chemotaxis protein methyltransferase CheR
MSHAASRTVPARDGRSLVDGEFPLTAEDFRVIAGMARADAGIALQDSKATLVYSRLAKRLRGLGLGSFAEYCVLVGTPAGEDERQHMLAALTTNVTRFFREPHHFDHLRTTLLPALAEHARRGGRVRLWSSACSSGQEPYSIAMTLLSVFPEAGQHDVRILATDIDPNMIAEGEAGVYNAAVLDAVPAELRRRWFAPVGTQTGMFQAAAELRALVHFRRLNLIGQWPIRGHFQAIFCRNVMIYFDAVTQAAIWTRMMPLLEPQGALYIGHSERVAGPATAFLRSDGITTYRRLAGAAP